MKRWPTEPVAPSTPGSCVRMGAIGVDGRLDGKAEMEEGKLRKRQVRTAFLLGEVPIVGCEVFGVHGLCRHEDLG